MKEIIDYPCILIKIILVNYNFLYYLDLEQNICEIKAHIYYIKNVTIETSMLDINIEVFLNMSLKVTRNLNDHFRNLLGNELYIIYVLICNRNIVYIIKEYLQSNKTKIYPWSIKTYDSEVRNLLLYRLS